MLQKSSICNKTSPKFTEHTVRLHYNSLMSKQAVDPTLYSCNHCGIRNYIITTGFSCKSSAREYHQTVSSDIWVSNRCSWTKELSPDLYIFSASPVQAHGGIKKQQYVLFLETHSVYSNTKATIKCKVVPVQAMSTYMGRRRIALNLSN